MAAPSRNAAFQSASAPVRAGWTNVASTRPGGGAQDGELANAELEAGARPCESLREIRLVISGHMLKRDARGADVLLASRPLIEGQVGRRVLALRNVTLRERCDGTDLVTSSDRKRVSGVRIPPRDDGGTEDVDDADLTVAARGRSARIPALLEEPRLICDRRRRGYGSTCSAAAD